MRRVPPAASDLFVPCVLALLALAAGSSAPASPRETDSYRVLAGTYSKKDVQSGAGNGGPTNFDLYSRYYTGGPQNTWGYANPDLDKLIDQQAVLSRDTEARKKHGVPVVQIPTTLLAMKNAR